MSISGIDTREWIRPPESLQSLGSCLYRILDRGTVKGFLCFLSWDESLFVYPPTSEKRERELHGLLVDLDWKSNPGEVFTHLFELLGITADSSAGHFDWDLISDGKEPVGAYAFVESSTALSNPTEKRTVRLFLAELIRCHHTIRRISQLVEEGDFLFSAINRTGCLLRNRAKRAQVFAALLDLSIHLVRADVGLLFISDGSTLEPEIEMGLAPELIHEIRFLPERDTLIERIATTQRAVVIDDVSGPTIQIPSSFDVSVKGLVAIPLLAERELIGLICLASGGPSDISTNQLESLETIAAVMSIAVENEQLHRGDAVAPSSAQTGVDLEVLAKLLQRVGEGILVASKDNNILYSNDAANRMIGLDGKRDGEAKRASSRIVSWLRDLWLEGCEKQEVRVPFPSVDGQPLTASLARLPADPVDPKAPAWLTLMRATFDPGDGPSLVKVTRLMRDLLNKVQLGVGISLNGAGTDGAASDRTQEALKRSLSGLLRLCEDVEETSNRPDRPRRRALVLEDILKQSLEALQRDNAEAPYDKAGILTSGTFVVLGDPLQLQNAFVRILVEIYHHAEDPRVPTISVKGAAAECKILFEFPYSEGPEYRPERYFSVEEPRDDGAEAGGHLSPGMQTAVRIISRHGGALSVSRTDTGLLELEVTLPVAPGSQSQLADHDSTHRKPRES